MLEELTGHVRLQIANSWRTTGDVGPSWESMLRCLVCPPFLAALGLREVIALVHHALGCICYAVMVAEV